MLRFQITEDIVLEGSFTLGNYLFKNELITNIIIREIIKEDGSLKAFKEIYGSAKYNKNYQKFLNNLPDDIKLRLELER